VSHEILLDRLFDALVSGDRREARAIVSEVFDQQNVPADRVITDLFWPVYERVETFYRNDQLSTLGRRLATRLLRVLVDQAALRLERKGEIGRRVFAVCGPNDADELAAQMAVDLLEAEGYDVRFAGGGIAMDEILGRVQEEKPEHLVIFASSPRDLPEIRGLIDSLNEIGACSPASGRVQVIVGGGVFNRAEGLAEEIGADLWAETPDELVEAMTDEPERRATPDQRTVGKSKAARSRRAVA